MDCLAWLRNIIIVDLWEIQNHDSGSGSSQQLHSQSSSGDHAVVEGQRNIMVNSV